jgi:D-alanyl-D-alanine carboxypeptidase
MEGRKTAFHFFWLLPSQDRPKFWTATTQRRGLQARNRAKLSYLCGMKSWMPALGVISLVVVLACSSSPSTAAGEKSPDSLAANLTSVVDSPITDTSASQIVTQHVVDSIAITSLLGKIVPSKDTAFAPIAQKYTTTSGIYLRRDAYAAFERMHAAALADGVKLVILSATRTFGDQKGIWENKWNGQTLVGGKNLSSAVPDPVERAKTILRYSSMPGSSRHHWGTDMDLNSLENSYFDVGAGKKTYEWLQAHAADFGFCQPYTLIGPERPHGYQEERWHWSYMPISSKFLRAYQAQVKLADITGFLGSETAQALNVIEHYVSGIAAPCRNW